MSTDPQSQSHLPRPRRPRRRRRRAQRLLLCLCRPQSPAIRPPTPRPLQPRRRHHPLAQVCAVDAGMHAAPRMHTSNAHARVAGCGFAMLALCARACALAGSSVAGAACARSLPWCPRALSTSPRCRGALRLSQGCRLPGPLMPAPLTRRRRPPALRVHDATGDGGPVMGGPADFGGTSISAVYFLPPPPSSLFRPPPWTLLLPVLS